MRRERIFLILGIWVAVLPYLGFPYSWKNILFTISGFIIIYYSYLIYRENKPQKKYNFEETFSPPQQDPYESRPSEDYNNQN